LMAAGSPQYVPANTMPDAPRPSTRVRPRSSDSNFTSAMSSIHSPRRSSTRTPAGSAAATRASRPPTPAAAAAAIVYLCAATTLHRLMQALQGCNPAQLWGGESTCQTGANLTAKAQSPVQPLPQYDTRNETAWGVGGALRSSVNIAGSWRPRFPTIMEFVHCGENRVNESMPQQPAIETRECVCMIWEYRTTRQFHHARHCRRHPLPPHWHVRHRQLYV